MKNSGFLIDELVAIQNNVDNGYQLTHAEVISFCRATISALENGYLLDSELNSETQAQIVFYLKLISAYGISHVHRCRMATKCIRFMYEAIAKHKKDMQESDF